MKLVQSMKTSCKAEEQKFYRGDESMTGVCNIVKCSTEFAEHRIISYVSKSFLDLVYYVKLYCTKQLLGNKCGCKKDGQINCHYEPYFWRRQQVGNQEQPLSTVICLLWDSVNFIQRIFGEIGTLKYTNK